MALTATASQGFEHVGYTSGKEVFYLPGDPGDTFTRGDMVYVNNGVLDVITDSIEPQAVVDRTTVCPGASQAASRAYSLDPGENAAADKCLIPVKPLVAAGVPIFEVTFSGHFDETIVAAYTPATPSLTLTTSPGANDDTNGSLIYIYSGPGKGEILIGADYVHATKVLTTHRVAEATLTTSTKLIILEGEGSGAKPIAFFGLMDAYTHQVIHAADGYADGNFMIWMDWITAPKLLQQLKVRVIPSRAMYNL